MNSIHIIYTLHLPSKVSTDLQGVRILHHHLRVTSFGDLRQGPRDGNRITLEHSHFGIAVKDKMLHHIRPQPINQTSDLLTGAALWKPRAFQSNASTKEKVPMRNVVLIGLPFTCDEILPNTCDEIVALHFCRSLATKCP